MTDITTNVLAHARSLHEREREARREMRTAVSQPDPKAFEMALGRWLRAYGEWVAVVRAGMDGGK